MTESNIKTIKRPIKECEECGRNAHFIHKLLIEWNLRSLCTACVLRLQPGCFCPICLTFYEELPPSSNSSDHVACSKPSCPSLAHSHCVGDALLSSYLCPTCKDSSFSFFPLDDNKIDKELALALLCASKISAVSMKKASVIAWAEAEKKAKEAAEAKKLATEAIEHLRDLTEKESARNKEKDDEIVSLEQPDMNMDGDEDTDSDDGDGNVDKDSGDGDGNVDKDSGDDPTWRLEDNLDTEEMIDCKFKYVSIFVLFSFFETDYEFS